MPAVAGVDSMKIVFCANEHPPAHFHAVIAEHRAVVAAALAHEKVERIE
jgi:hypothetical protein